MTENQRPENRSASFLRNLVSSPALAFFLIFLFLAATVAMSTIKGRFLLYPPHEIDGLSSTWVQKGEPYGKGLLRFLLETPLIDKSAFFSFYDTFIIEKLDRSACEYITSLFYDLRDFFSYFVFLPFFCGSLFLFRLLTKSTKTLSRYALWISLFALSTYIEVLSFGIKLIDMGPSSLFLINLASIALLFLLSRCTEKSHLLIGVISFLSILFSFLSIFSSGVTPLIFQIFLVVSSILSFIFLSIFLSGKYEKTGETKQLVRYLLLSLFLSLFLSFLIHKIALLRCAYDGWHIATYSFQYR